jgi:hypothetical protein
MPVDIGADAPPENLLLTQRTLLEQAWEQILRFQGKRNPLPRMRMLDGFNEG